MDVFTQNYYSRIDDAFVFSKQQGSDFAKKIAGDFNPLHDTDNSRFCIPGDLLFSVMLAEFGVSKSMDFDFQGMISGDMPVHFVQEKGSIEAKNDKNKTLLQLKRSGEISTNLNFVEGLIRSYVAFSGKTFPHIIIKLMKEQGMMINTKKPMVIYDQMSLSLNNFSERAPDVLLKECDFKVTGKRGMVTMNFDIVAENETIGTGEKQIIMSSLRPYMQEDIDYLVDAYNESKNKLVS